MANPFETDDGVFLISEIGGNHEGDFKFACELTDLAIESGANAVKFQIYTGDSIVNHKIDPQRNSHFKKFQLKPEEYLALAQRCENANTMFLASVWDIQAYEWINPHLKMYKVGSGDLTAYDHLAKISDTGKPIILSTGLSSMEQVQESVNFICKRNPSYQSQKKLALLQCTSLYPNHDDQVNLNCLKTLKEAFNLPVGYSDHTTDMLALEIAVSLGAQILEAHFTDSRQGKTFRDHKISLTSSEFKQLRQRAKRISKLLGQHKKALSPSEIELGHHLSFRRAVYAHNPIKKGQIVKLEDLVSLRPLVGICASKIFKLVGKRAPQDFEALDPLGDLESWNL